MERTGDARRDAAAVRKLRSETAQYSRGVLVQTIGKMEDNPGYETIHAASEKHK